MNMAQNTHDVFESLLQDTARALPKAIELWTACILKEKGQARRELCTKFSIAMGLYASSPALSLLDSLKDAAALEAKYLKVSSAATILAAHYSRSAE
jgi:hypothetical protein